MVQSEPSESVPRFRFYADPVGDGQITESSEACASCGRSRGWISNAALYSDTVPDDAMFCPWCIADGSAAARFDGSFNELEAAVASGGDELTRRTPNFESWQDLSWPVHCDVPAVYLGQPTGAEINAEAAIRSAVERDLAESGELSPDQIEDVIDTCGPDSSARVYLFRCEQCSQHLARQDYD